MQNENKKQMPSLSIHDHGYNINHSFDFVDPTIVDWFNAFRGLMVGITYSEDQINQFIVDYANELIEENNESPQLVIIGTGSMR